MQTVVKKRAIHAICQTLEFPREDIRPIVEECIQELHESQYPEEAVKELLSFKNDLTGSP